MHEEIITPENRGKGRNDHALRGSDQGAERKALEVRAQERKGRKIHKTVMKMHSALRWAIFSILMMAAAFLLVLFVKKFEPEMIDSPIDRREAVESNETYKVAQVVAGRKSWRR